MANGKQNYVSDLIGEDYKKWNNEFIILDCDTGTGKTYFSIEVLGRYAQENNKTILYLCNRRELREQVYKATRDANLLGVIKIMTYQKLQNQRQKRIILPHYDYIIADECHYFTTDAMFNDYTGDSFYYVMGQMESVVIFTSATAKNFFDSLLNDGKVAPEHYYKLEKDYSYVDKLYFYQKKDLAGIIKDILASRPDDKILVFLQSENRMFEMYDEFGDKAQYFCSRYAKSERLRDICGWTIPGIKKDSKKRIKDSNPCVKRYSEDKITFSKQILFTTTVLDNGVDIKDRNLKHIFTELIDVDLMVQAFGRKRPLDSNDTCRFYIKEFQKRGIQGLLNRVNYQLEPAELSNRNYDAFYAKYGEGKNRGRIQGNKIFYIKFKGNKKDSKIQVNKCRYRKYQQDKVMFTAMKDMGYIEYIKSVLPEHLTNVSEFMVANVDEIDSLLEFLKQYEGKRLYKEEREVILNKFKTSIATKLSGRSVGIKTLNGQLDDLYADHYPFRFENTGIDGRTYIDKRRKCDDGLENPYRDKSYWILEDRMSKLVLG